MTVRFQRRGPVAVLTIDRPEVHNAIDPATHEALVRAWRRFRDDDKLRCAVLTGAGTKAFSSGVDVRRLKDWYGSVPDEKRRRVWDREPGLGGLTRNLDPEKPVVAAIRGYCFGGGVELALACDLRIAATDATFAMPETGIGILPGQGGTQRLARLVGPSVALELILTGARIDAATALRVGLVNRVVEPERVLPEALDVAAQIAKRSPRAVQDAREAILRGLDLPLVEGLRLEQALAEPLRREYLARSTKRRAR